MEQVDAAQYNNKNDHNKKGRPTSKNNLEKQLSKIFFLSHSHVFSLFVNIDPQGDQIQE